MAKPPLTDPATPVPGIPTMQLVLRINRGQSNEMPMIDMSGLRNKIDAGIGQLPDVQQRVLDELESHLKNGRVARFLDLVAILTPQPRCIRVALVDDRLAVFRSKVRALNGPVILGLNDRPTDQWDKLDTALAPTKPAPHSPVTMRAPAAVRAPVTPPPDDQPVPEAEQGPRLVDLVDLARTATPPQLAALQQLNTMLAAERTADFLKVIRRMAPGARCVRIKLTGDELAIVQLQSRGLGGPVVIGPQDPVAERWLDVKIRASWL